VARPQVPRVSGGRPAVALCSGAALAAAAAPAGAAAPDQLWNCRASAGYTATRERDGNLANGRETVVVIGRPFESPSGGRVALLTEAPRSVRNSPCLKGKGVNYIVLVSAKADRITGTNKSDRIFTFGGKDHVAGGRGNDCVDGGSGGDRLSGSLGADRLIGGSGDRGAVDVVLVRDRRGLAAGGALRCLASDV
jgi:hypothetical protein